MRWQKPARLAIAAFVIVFAAIVFVALRRPERPTTAPTSPRKNAATVAEVGAFEHKRYSPEGKLTLWVKGSAHGNLPDGKKVGKVSTVTLPDRNGRTVTIAAGEMEILPPEKQGQSEISLGKMSGGVKLTTSDGLEVTSKEASYDDKTGVVTVPGDVQFVRGRMTGSGVGATYDQTRDVLWLLANARIVVKPDDKGGGAVEATAATAGFARPDHYVRLTGSAHVVSDGRTLEAQDLTVQLTPDDRLIQTMALRGDSRITGSPGANGAEGMSARDIDLTYGPDGRTLQQARLMENAVAQLSGEPGQARAG